MPPERKPSPFAPAEFVAHFEHAGRERGFRVEEFGRIGGCPLIALTKRTAGVRPRIYLSSGIHGDEPAPPLAMLEMLEAGVFDDRAHWLICPLLNPIGFTRATRETEGGVDLNRDYRHLVSVEIRQHTRWLQGLPNFDLALCLHEDWESTGFYLYELNPENRATLADPMIEAVSHVCPIETATIIDGHESNAPGIIRPIADPMVRELWPETIYLRAHHTTLTYTLESPSALPMPTRISALRTAVETAICSR